MFTEGAHQGATEQMLWTGTGGLGCWSQFLWAQGPMEPDSRLCPTQPTCLGTHPKDMGIAVVNSE